MDWISVVDGNYGGTWTGEIDGAAKGGKVVRGGGCLFGLVVRLLELADERGRQAGDDEARKLPSNAESPGETLGTRCKARRAEGQAGGRAGGQRTPVASRRVLLAC